MKFSIRLFLGLASLSIAAGMAHAQAGPADENASQNPGPSPVAFVYATRPTHLDGFAAAANGKLTPVPGSPFSTPQFFHLSVNKKFLFGFTGTEIYSYSIAADGALHQVAVTNALQIADPCTDGYELYPTSIDASGSTLYVPVAVCPADDKFVQALEAFKIESNGELQYLGASPPTEFQGPVTILGNDKFAYMANCQPINASADWYPWTATYTRESDGFLSPNHDSFPMPPKYYPSPDWVCPEGLAADPTNHIALAEDAFSPKTHAGYTPLFLASYTADSHGNLTTTNTTENMAQAQTGFNLLSISPTGKLLAIGGGDFGSGFQVFHFNGADPITNFTEPIETNNPFYFSEFGWDKSDHLYAVAYGTGLYVYTVTPTSINPAPGSPYSIPETSSLIVVVK
ncbi:MAG: hypothetical protein ABSF53_22730 [Terracidiphilus sp.]|jgi:hypothetical protein